MRKDREEDGAKEAMKRVSKRERESPAETGMGD